jgi:hypothetical protein
MTQMTINIVLNIYDAADDLERELLDDVKLLQMFEKRVSTNREIRAYTCHIGLALLVGSVFSCVNFCS